MELKERIEQAKIEPLSCLNDLLRGSKHEEGYIFSESELKELLREGIRNAFANGAEYGSNWSDIDFPQYFDSLNLFKNPATRRTADEIVFELDQIRAKYKGQRPNQDNLNNGKNRIDESIGLIESYARSHAINFMKYWNAGMHSDKVYEKFYNEWLNQQTKP